MQCLVCNERTSNKIPDCNCTICNECLLTWIIVSFSSIYEFSCPNNNNCHNKCISNEKLKELWGKQNLIKYNFIIDKKIKEDYFRKEKSLVQCPSVYCTLMSFYPNNNKCFRKFECPYCNNLFFHERFSYFSYIKMLSSQFKHWMEYMYLNYDINIFLLYLTEECESCGATDKLYYFNLICSKCQNKKSTTVAIDYIHVVNIQFLTKFATVFTLMFITIFMFPTYATTTYSYSQVLLYYIVYYIIACILTLIILVILFYGLKLLLYAYGFIDGNLSYLNSPIPRAYFFVVACLFIKIIKILLEYDYTSDMIFLCLKANFVIILYNFIQKAVNFKKNKKLRELHQNSYIKYNLSFLK